MINLYNALTIETTQPENSEHMQNIATVNDSTELFLDGEMDADLYLDIVNELGFSVDRQLDRMEGILKQAGAI